MNFPSLKHLIFLVISLITFAYTFLVVGNFMMFLSSPRNIEKPFVWVFNLMDSHSRIKTALPVIVYDLLYIILFIFQHSFMKSQLIRSLFQKLGLQSLERTIYTLTSSLCLKYLLTNWKSAQSIVLWQFKLDESKALWWTFISVHVICWTVIYGGCLIMDLPEILGIKQVFFDMKRYAQPTAYKSYELRQLYQHIRHPSFLCLTLIFWCTNLMSLDRLILAVMMTAYMYVGWSSDKNDVLYQKSQLIRKKYELN
ncbi:NRM family protein [Megaselia abdita]